MPAHYSMSAVRRIGVEERRARLGIRHQLACPATAPVEVARGVVALHATDPASVFLSCHARAASVTVEAIERALYDERLLVRMLGMRRTMFVVPVELAPVIQAACTNAIAVQQQRTYAKLLAAGGVGDGAWLAEVADAAARALAVRGEATGAQLSTDESRLRTRVHPTPDKPYTAPQNITSWVLMLLAAQGRIVRGRPNGSWTSSQWRWSPIEAWLPDGVPDLPVETARAALVRQWLAAFGPGTVADLRWWTGWPAGQVKQAMEANGAVEVDLDGTVGFLLPDDLEPVAEPAPWVALLPALDPTPMGWYQRDWYLGGHAPILFDRTGNIGPTVWSNGRIIGGWAQRATGEVVYRLLEEVGRDVAAAVETAAGRLAGWIGGVRVTPRFRTPLEKELTR
jgi:Winged helix DNA-binding domain